MQSKSLGRILIIVGFILIIPLTILFNFLSFKYLIGTNGINIELLNLLSNLLFWTGCILLVIGVFIVKNYKRDWIYTIGLLFVGILGFNFHIALGIILLSVSIFFALYLFEEGDKHGLIVACVDIFFIVYVIIIALGYYHWVF